jgi:hypothetical protein
LIFKNNYNPCQRFSLKTNMTTKREPGRPEVPENKAKTIMRGAMFGPDEVKAVDKAIEQSGQDKSKWIRDAALEKAQRKIWGRSKFSKEELHDQLIDFELTSANGVIGGTGRIGARQNPKGEIAVDIFIDRQLDKDGKWVGYRIWIEGAGVSRIELNPKKGGSKFRLLA